MNTPDNDPASTDTPLPPNHVKLAAVNLVLLAFLLIAFIAAGFCAGTLAHAPTVILWALACLAVGAFIGLLFGVPRMRQNPESGTKDRPAEDSGYRPEINNNLIEISDWLTKIIVGIGLIELSSLPEKLKMMAGPLADCLHSECGLAVAVGIIIYFTTAGFLAGYINVRTFIAVMLKESDMQLLAQFQALKVRVAQEEVVTKLQLLPKSQPAQAPRPPGAEAMRARELVTPPSELLLLAREYESVQIADYRERVAAKDRIAESMAALLVRESVPKSNVLAWIEAQPSDGLIIGFASYVIALPEAEDLPKLLRASRSARLLHVKYRVCLALRALFRLSFGQSEDWKQALTLLDDYRSHARGRHDASLLAMSQEMIDLIRTRPA